MSNLNPVESSVGFLHSTSSSFHGFPSSVKPAYNQRESEALALAAAEKLFLRRSHRPNRRPNTRKIIADHTRLVKSIEWPVSIGFQLLLAECNAPFAG